jgi:phospholipase/lecithinase/hemolysin
MKKFHPSWVAAAATALLVACSGGGEGDQSPRVEYGKMITFGDSLSDVGSYNVGVVASMGGGRYTINTGDPVNWTELLATTLGLDALCSAQTGLNSAADLGGHQPIEDHAGCYSYAQGGARVTDDVGPGNEALWLVYGLESGKLGQLTVPVQKQIQRHLDLSNGSFASGDLVTVMAGGNDLFMTIPFVFQGTLAQTGDLDQAKAAANAAMTAAGAQLAGYVKDSIVAKGAERVVVVNLPDVSSTPAYLSADADSGTDTDDFVTRALVLELVQAYNTALATGLEDSGTSVLLVDAFSVSQDQAAHPTQYGLTNVTTPACDLENMPLATSLACSTDTLVAGVTETWQYADTVHPTPYGYKLLAQLVTAEMSKKGWL